MAVPAFAQGTQISLGGLNLDGSEPLEVNADMLSVDQASGNAVFDGNVSVVQGALELTAGKLSIAYAENGNDAGISRMEATGGVRLANAGDTVEASSAIYDLKSGVLEMVGGVVLKQGQTRISGDRFTVDLTTGAGRMDGRVRTVFGAQDN